MYEYNVPSQETIDLIIRRAERERAQYMNKVLISAFKAVFGLPARVFTGRFRPART